MKKLLLLLFVYLLVEGENVIGDGLYVFHRGSHAVEQLKTKIDDYYPKVKAVHKEMADALSRPYDTERTETMWIADTCKYDEQFRPVINR